MNFIEMFNALNEDNTKIFKNDLTGDTYFFDDYWGCIKKKR